MSLCAVQEKQIGRHETRPFAANNDPTLRLSTEPITSFSILKSCTVYLVTKWSSSRF